MGRQRPFDFFAWNSRSFDANVTSRYFSINNDVTDLDDLNTSSAAYRACPRRRRGGSARMRLTYTQGLRRGSRAGRREDLCCKLG